MSISRFTLCPFFKIPKFVFLRVKGIRSTENLSLSSFEIVRLTPFIVIEPFSAKYFAIDFGKLVHKITFPFSFFKFSTVPIVSMCPWTRWPFMAWLRVKAGSRFTSLFVFRSMRFVFSSVSGIALNEN